MVESARKSNMTIMTLFEGIKNLNAVLLQSTNFEFNEGLEYFNEMRRHVIYPLSHKHNVSIQTVAGVFAALSPNNNERRNIIDADTVLLNRDSVKEFSVCTFSANKEKALRIARGDNPLNVLSGRKVLAFYDNLSNLFSDQITVDGYMYSMWVGRQIPLKSTAQIMNQDLYEEILRGVRCLARERGIRPECSLQPILWLTWRRMHGIDCRQMNLFSENRLEGMIKLNDY